MILAFLFGGIFFTVMACCAHVYYYWSRPDMRMSIFLPFLLGVFFITLVVRERNLHTTAQNLKPNTVIEKTVNKVASINVKVWDFISKAECREIKMGDQKTLKSLFDKKVKMTLLAPLMDDNTSDNDRQYIFIVPLSQTNPCVERVLIRERDVGMLGVKS